jgi:DNA-binding CsgD family transcriptional regulator
VASFTLGRLGRIDAGIDAADRGHAAHLALAQPLDWYPWTHVFFRCQVLAWGGRLDEAETAANAQYQQALVDGSDEGRAWFAWHLVSTAGDRGHVRTAIQYGREAVALFQKLGRPQFMSFCLPYLATALALGGHTEEAAAAVQQLDDLGVSHLFMGVDPLQARAWVAASAGDLRAAQRLLEEAAAQGDEIGDLTGRAAALHGLARLGRAKDVVERLTEQAGALECDLATARAAHVEALVRGRADDLLAASETFEAMGADLLAAEAAADAAVAWRKAGDPRKATAAERRVAVLVDRCESPITPALQAVETRARLAPAEREAAVLAATGLSNREIAEQLYLSVRTVEGRLQRAYEKLGVSSRAELAAALTVIHGR